MNINKNFFWWDCLSPLQKEQFKENCNNYYEGGLEWFLNTSEEPTFKDFCLAAFVFDKTPQGGNYWWEIAYRFMKNKRWH